MTCCQLMSSPECLFVSNTSTMTIKEISEGCSADRRKVYALITFVGNA